MPLAGTAGILDRIIFGDGSDGDATISTSTTLTSDRVYRDLTVQKGATLFGQGFKVYVQRTLTIEGDIDGVGIISCNGQNGHNSIASPNEVSGISPNGDGTPGGGQATGGTLGPGGRGGAGMYNGGRGIGNTAHPIESGSVTNVLAVDLPTAPPFCFGGAGGQGGDAASGSIVGPGHVPGSDYYRRVGDIGASGTIVTSSFGNIHGFFTVCTGGALGHGNFVSVSGSFTTGSFRMIGGGAGGGAGAAFNSGALGIKPRSGPGGGAGGVVFICARDVVLDGRIEAKGGSGGNTFFKAGGGGGGGGGFIFLAYSSISSRFQIDQHLVVDGGAPGIGQTSYANMTGALPGTTGSFVTYRID